MALSLRDVRRDPIANRALNELMHQYTVAEEKSRLVLTKTAGDMKLFLYDLDDLHQMDFARNQQMMREIERLRVRSSTSDQQRESWKVRALMAEAQLLEATAKASNNGGGQNVSDLRYASLKRYLAKRFHPDYAPGQGIEKIVRNEIDIVEMLEVGRIFEIARKPTCRGARVPSSPRSALLRHAGGKTMRAQPHQGEAFRGVSARKRLPYLKPSLK